MADNFYGQSESQINCNGLESQKNITSEFGYARKKVAVGLKVFLGVLRDKISSRLVCFIDEFAHKGKFGVPTWDLSSKNSLKMPLWQYVH